jgi:hypothetical protein
MKSVDGDEEERLAVRQERSDWLGGEAMVSFHGRRRNPFAHLFPASSWGFVAVFLAGLILGGGAVTLWGPFRKRRR